MVSFGIDLVDLGLLGVGKWVVVDVIVFIEFVE